MIIGSLLCLWICGTSVRLMFSLFGMHGDMLWFGWSTMPKLVSSSSMFSLDLAWKGYGAFSFNKNVLSPFLLSLSPLFSPPLHVVSLCPCLSLLRYVWYKCLVMLSPPFWFLGKLSNCTKLILLLSFLRSSIQSKEVRLLMFQLFVPCKMPYSLEIKKFMFVLCQIFCRLLWDLEFETFLSKF